MKMQKNVSIKDFKKMAISGIQAAKLKGGETWRGNVAIIVDWN